MSEQAEFFIAYAHYSREFPCVGVRFPLWMSAKASLTPKLLEAILLLGAIMAGQGVKASAELLKNAVVANPTAKHTATVSLGLVLLI